MRPRRSGVDLFAGEGEGEGEGEVGVESGALVSCHAEDGQAAPGGQIFGKVASGVHVVIPGRDKASVVAADDLLHRQTPDASLGRHLGQRRRRALVVHVSLAPSRRPELVIASARLVPGNKADAHAWRESDLAAMRLGQRSSPTAPTWEPG